MCRCWQIPLALGLIMFDLVTPNRFQKIPIAILDEKWIHLFVVITKKCVFWLKNYFFLRSRSLKTNNSFLVSFFFGKILILSSCQESERVWVLWNACVCLCVFRQAWRCSDLVLFCLLCPVYISVPQKEEEEKKKSRQRDEQQLVEATFEFPTCFSPQLILSFSLHSGWLFCLGFMTCASWLLWSINKR